MKAILLLIAMISLSAGAMAAEDKNEIVGTYSKCVEWTTVNGVPSSKKFEFIHGADRSMLLRIELHNGSSICEGMVVKLQEYSQFEILNDEDSSAFRLVDVKETKKDIYMQITIMKSIVNVIFSKSYPVVMDMQNSVLIRRNP